MNNLDALAAHTEPSQFDNEIKILFKLSRKPLPTDILIKLSKVNLQEPWPSAFNNIYSKLIRSEGGNPGFLFFWWQKRLDIEFDTTVQRDIVYLKQKLEPYILHFKDRIRSTL